MLKNNQAQEFFAFLKCTSWFLVLSFLFIYGFVFTITAQELDKNLVAGFNSIQPMDPYNYCKELALPKYSGRLTGHEGYTEAAKWAAEKFREWGLKPINKTDGYLQPFPCPYTLVASAEMTLLLPQADTTKALAKKALTCNKDFLPLLFTDSGDFSAGLVFAGWGISAPELNYDDYAGLNVNGKIVLCFRGVPDRENLAFEDFDQHRHRLQTAKEKGARGLFYIYPEPIANPNGDWLEGFCPAMISEQIADTLFREKNPSVAAIKKELTTSKKPHSFYLNSKINYDVHARHFPNGIGYNVAGYVEGSDPQLKKECLVLGGHLDHCGKHLDLLFAGANDNASGSAVVLEIAEAFSKLAVPPKRSVVFVLFGAEEMGLLGSTHFAHHLPEQFSRVDAMFNFDMTGEGDGTNFGYSSSVPELKSCLERADQFVATVRNSWEIKHVGVRSSDFAPFYLKGASCAAFFSNGPHVFYHKIGDTIYRINPDMLADIAKLAFLAGYFWADR